MITGGVYARRHWEMANKGEGVGHRFLAALECIPVVGSVVALIERLGLETSKVDSDSVFLSGNPHSESCQIFSSFGSSGFRSLVANLNRPTQIVDLEANEKDKTTEKQIITSLSKNVTFQRVSIESVVQYMKTEIQNLTKEGVLEGLREINSICKECSDSRKGFHCNFSNKNEFVKADRTMCGEVFHKLDLTAIERGLKETLARWESDSDVQIELKNFKQHAIDLESSKTNEIKAIDARYSSRLTPHEEVDAEKEGTRLGIQRALQALREKPQQEQETPLWQARVAFCEEELRKLNALSR